MAARGRVRNSRRSQTRGFERKSKLAADDDNGTVALKI
jgi:hypothetical protein